MFAYYPQISCPCYESTLQAFYIAVRFLLRYSSYDALHVIAFLFTTVLYYVCFNGIGRMGADVNRNRVFLDQSLNCLPSLLAQAGFDESGELIYGGADFSKGGLSECEPSPITS